MKAFFKLTVWTALVLGLLGAVLGALMALGLHQGWFDLSEVNWVVNGRQVLPQQLSGAEWAALAGTLALALGLVFLVLGLILPIGLLIALGATALGLAIALPFIGLGLFAGAIPYLIVALLVWWMWKLAHPKAKAPTPSQPPQ
jgi:hypothetical protein